MERILKRDIEQSEMQPGWQGVAREGEGDGWVRI